MVLHFTDDDADIASMDIPDTFYLDNNDGDDGVAEGGENPHDSGTTDTDKSISSRQRQKQRLQVPNQESGNWFSNWIMHHPRRKQKQSRDHRLRNNQATVLSTNTNGSRIKVHPSPTPPSTTTTTTGNNTTSTPPILNGTDIDDEDGRGGGHSTKQKYNEKKRTLPLIRYATLSDLSSLSSSNPSHLMKSSATVGSTSGQKIRRHLLPLYHHQRHDLAANAPSSYRFSAFWKSQSGKTGKQVIHVDEQGLAGHATLWSSWATCNYEKSGNILATLFIFGFLLCPCWWLGAVLYLARTSHFDNDLQSMYLWTPRTFGHLNCWMSAVSILLVGFIGALAIWYHLSVV
ncbi:hypothetical protein BCR42DRAFT_404448 [Absidia repens]|uniref:Uncharacterized protein n=1 Tax=Absidia repens TaxID=90262 RepID=A0A1X2IW98_9FUNG|nr:hypothetical protein BCR42DRAFT_404448 [Absidia repens]